MDKPEHLEYEPLEQKPRYRIPIYRQVLSGVLLLMGLITFILGCTVNNSSAQANFFTVAMGMGVWGVAIRYQHIGL